MTTALYSLNMLFASSSSHPQNRMQMSLKVQSSFTPQSPLKKERLLCFKTLSGCKQNRGLASARLNIACAMNMAAGQSDEPKRINLDYVTNKARKLWDTAPQPVKSFPWNRALDNFIQIIVDLFVTVVKYLSVPLLAITSLSEMSYCAHQKKLFIVPFPLVIGIALAGALNATALELSPLLKEAEIPWHLIMVAIFFSLIKLPGPYYSYWGRLLIPHFANGVLWTTVWLTYVWYRRPRNASSSSTPVNRSHYLNQA